MTNTNTTDSMSALATELVARGMSKREVMERVVAVVREAFPGMDDAGVKAIGWEFYKGLCGAA